MRHAVLRPAACKRRWSRARGGGRAPIESYRKKAASPSKPVPPAALISLARPLNSLMPRESIDEKAASSSAITASMCARLSPSSGKAASRAGPRTRRAVPCGARAGRAVPCGARAGHTVTCGACAEMCEAEGSAQQWQHAKREPPQEARTVTQVEARGVPQVEARGVTQVEARGVTQVEARTVTQVEARGVTQVEARGVTQ
eukprot:2763372-Prymnesium_polylepis.1